MQKGKFIVFYGINNLGKSTQANLLVENLKKEGLNVEYLKYPSYDLEPSGPIINSYLRQGNPYQLKPREVQILYALNRTQYDHILREKLASGINIVCEDYSPTSIAWGVKTGVDKEFLVRINNHLKKEDLVFHFYGKRFSEGIEQNHKFEQDDTLTQKVAEEFSKLSKEYDWINVNANQSIEDISHYILHQTLEILK